MRQPILLPCGKSNECWFQPNDNFVGGGRTHVCEHGETFEIKAETQRAVVFTTRNITPREKKNG